MGSGVQAQFRRHRSFACDHHFLSGFCGERNGEIDFATAKAVLSRLDGWSLSVQLHKILGFR